MLSNVIALWVFRKIGENRQSKGFPQLRVSHQVNDLLAWHHLPPLGITWCNLEPSWHHLAPPGTTWYHLVQPGTILNHIGPSPQFHREHSNLSAGRPDWYRHFHQDDHLKLTRCFPRWPQSKTGSTGIWRRWWKKLAKRNKAELQYIYI